MLNSFPYQQIYQLLYLVICACFVAGCATTPSPASLANTADSKFQARFQDTGSTSKTSSALSSGSTSGQDISPNGGSARDSIQATGDPSQIVKAVKITGNASLSESEIQSRIGTRVGRYFDPDQLQQDVNELWKVRQIRRVNGPFVSRQPDGVSITIEIVERPYIHAVRYIGNRALPDRRLAEETGLADGDPLDLQTVKLAKIRLEDLYQEEGYPKTQVTIVEGDESGDQNVTFLIHEDKLQRVLKVEFEGNELASDARLRSFIETKPGIGWIIGGKVNRRELEQDKLRLEAYYRGLGYFNARVGRELIENEEGNWLTIRYVINEGPRYRIRNVSFIGNEKYGQDQLLSVIKMKPTEELPDFNASKMNEDQQRLEDLYGSEGHVFANVRAEPRFLEEPGLLDLVYNIEEGKQYRVGQINIIIDGEYGITKRQVVLNRLGLRPGDLIDTRMLTAAERRLLGSRLFADGSANAPGNPPSVTVRPLDGAPPVRRSGPRRPAGGGSGSRTAGGGQGSSSR